MKKLFCWGWRALAILVFAVLFIILFIVTFLHDRDSSIRSEVLSVTMDYSDGISYCYRLKVPKTNWVRVCSEPFPIYVPADIRTVTLRFQKEKLFLNGELYGLIVRNEADVLDNYLYRDQIRFLMVFGRFASLMSADALGGFSRIRAMTYFSPTQADLNAICATQKRIEVLDLWFDYFRISDFSGLSTLSSLTTLAIRSTNHPPFPKGFELNGLQAFTYTCDKGEEMALGFLRNSRFVEIENPYDTPVTIKLGFFANLPNADKLSLLGVFRFDSAIVSLPEKLTDLNVQDPTGKTFSDAFFTNVIFPSSMIATLQLKFPPSALQIAVESIVAGTETLEINGLYVRGIADELLSEDVPDFPCMFERDNLCNLDVEWVKELMREGYPHSYICNGFLTPDEYALYSENYSRGIGGHIGVYFGEPVGKGVWKRILSDKRISELYLDYHRADDFPFESFEAGSFVAKDINALYINLSLSFPYERLFRCFPNLKRLYLLDTHGGKIILSGDIRNALSALSLDRLSISRNEHFQAFADWVKKDDTSGEFLPGISITMKSNLTSISVGDDQGWTDTDLRSIISLPQLLIFRNSNNRLRKEYIEFETHNSWLKTREFRNKELDLYGSNFLLQPVKRDITLEQVLLGLDRFKGCRKLSLDWETWGKLREPLPRTVSVLSNVQLNKDGFDVSLISAPCATVFPHDTRFGKIGANPSLNLEMVGGVVGYGFDPPQLASCVIWRKDNDKGNDYYAGSTPLLYYWRDSGSSVPSYRQDYSLKNYQSHKPEFSWARE